MARLLGAQAPRGDEPAVIDPTGSTSWRGLDDRTNRLIHHLRDAGVVSGDRVALVAGNRREIAEVHLACLHAGWQCVPVNWHFRSADIAFVLADSGATALVCGSGYAGMAAGALVQEPGAAPRARLVMAHRPGDPPPPDGFASYEDALASASAEEPTDQMLGGVVFYTSGTTGRPKGVRSTGWERGLELDVDRLPGGSVEGVDIPRGGVTLLCGPHYHSAQWAFSFHPLVTGSTMVVRPRFVAEQVLATIDEHAITNVHLVPTQFIRLLRAGARARNAFDGSSLRVVIHGAAPCPPRVKRSMIDWWGPILTEYYGATEGGIVTTITSEEWLRRPGSVGRAVPGVEVRIVTETGTAAAPGREGVVHVRRSADRDFEYLNAPEQTAEAHLEPGFMTIGDVGRLDEDGYLYLSDRKVDTVVSGGRRIYPAEVESVLLTHPSVLDAAVVGVPDGHLGEALTAVIELPPDVEWGPALEAELRELVRRQLSAPKRPRHFDVVETMPRTEAGKLLRRVIRARYWESTTP